MSKNNRINIYTTVMFKHPTTNEEVEVDIKLPFPVFIEALRSYADKYFLVNLDGTDNAIWNLFIDLGCFNDIEYNKDFMELFLELYNKSEFKEEDFEEWLDEYNYDHNLGEYSEEQ